MKGTYDLLSAIRLLSRCSPPLRFVLIGVGATMEDDENVSGFVRENGLDSCVVLAGRVSEDEKWRFLCESDVMVFPTLGEMFPVTLVEGLAAGLPVVTTAVDYLPRLIVDGENGLIVRPGSPSELAEALLALGIDGERRRRMSAANLQKYETEFALDVVARRLREIYEELLETGRLPL